MRIIVFGGTGFIGNALLKLPSFQKLKVVVVTRSLRKTSIFKQENVETLVWDYQNQQAIRQLFRGEYAIINLSGEGIAKKRWSHAQKKTIIESRINTTRMIADTALKAEDKPIAFLQASATGYYGSQGDTELTESHATGKGFLAEVCNAWENSVPEALRKQCRVVFLRTGLVLTKNEGFLSRFSIPFYIFLGGHFGNGKQWLPWIHKEDEVRAIEHLFFNPKASGPYNLVAPQPVQMKLFSRVLAKALHRPSWFHTPAFLIRLVLKDFGEELLLGSQKAVPTGLQKLDFEFKFNDLKEAIYDLYV